MSSSGRAVRPPTFHSVAETAEILRMSEMTLYRAIAEGEFPAVRVRSRLVVPARAIDDMVASALAGNCEVNAAEWRAVPAGPGDDGLRPGGEVA